MFWNKERRKQQQCGISHSLMVSGAAQDGASYAMYVEKEESGQRNTNRSTTTQIKSDKCG